MIKYFIWLLISGVLMGIATEFDLPLYASIPIVWNAIVSIFCSVGRYLKIKDTR